MADPAGENGANGHFDFVGRASVFQSPASLARLLEHCRPGIPSEQFFNRSENQPIKDAWQATRFALGYETFFKRALEVRICAPDQFPDFQVRIEGRVYDFEATMLLAPDRRPGADARTNGDAAEEPRPRLDVQLVRQSIANKQQKHYVGRIHLLVYLNVGSRKVRLAELAKVSSGPESGAFESIWFVTDYLLMAGKPSPDLGSMSRWFPIPGK